jgi:PAS domain S-box-containing protein
MASPGADSDEMLLRYLENAHDMVIACDRSGRITFANAAAGAGFGLTPGELVGRDLLDGVEELSRSLAANILQMSLETEGWHGEILLERAGRTVFPAYVSASPIRDSSGQVQRILVIAQDVSERKRLEEEIRKRAEIANSIIRSAPIGIFTLDIDRTFKAVNFAFTEMMGIRKPSALLDRRFGAVAGRMNPDLVKAVEDGLAGEEIYIHNKPLFSGSAGEPTVSFVSVPLRDPDGNVEGVLVIVENRTELVRVEEQLLQADKLASTGFLAAGIAHEINNPLTGIYTIIDTLAKRVRREGGNEEPYQRILGNIDRIKDIIRRLLEFANPARIQAQKSDMNALVVQVLDFFKFHPVFRKVAVVWDLDESLPEIVVDPKQIQQIFHNLAMNAAQAMKDSGGELDISSQYVEPAEEDGKGWIEVRVRDTGPGIAEENLRRVFDPFFTTKPPGEGTGLGLSVSYSIAKNHGGDLIARNHPDGGAEFTLRLPCSRE